MSVTIHLLFLAKKLQLEAASLETTRLRIGNIWENRDPRKFVMWYKGVSIALGMQTTACWGCALWDESILAIAGGIALG